MASRICVPCGEDFKHSPLRSARSLISVRYPPLPALPRFPSPMQVRVYRFTFLSCPRRSSDPDGRRLMALIVGQEAPARLSYTDSRYHAVAASSRLSSRPMRPSQLQTALPYTEQGASLSGIQGESVTLALIRCSVPGAMSKNSFLRGYVAATDGDFGRPYLGRYPIRTSMDSGRFRGFACPHTLAMSCRVAAARTGHLAIPGRHWVDGLQSSQAFLRQWPCQAGMDRRLECCLP